MAAWLSDVSTFTFSTTKSITALAGVTASTSASPAHRYALGVVTLEKIIRGGRQGFTPMRVLVFGLRITDSVTVTESVTPARRQLRLGTRLGGH